MLYCMPHSVPPCMKMKGWMAAEKRCRSQLNIKVGIIMTCKMIDENICSDVARDRKSDSRFHYYIQATSILYSIQ